MSTQTKYENLTALERARLANTNEREFRSLKRDHAERLYALRAQLPTCKTLAEHRQVVASIGELEGIPSGQQAEPPTQLTDYAKLKPVARAELASTDPARYQALRNQHYARVEAIADEFHTTVGLDARRRLCAELDALRKPGTLALADLGAPSTPPARALSQSQLADAAMERAYRANPHLRPKGPAAA
jgi:hypothetical protein